MGALPVDAADPDADAGGLSDGASLGAGTQRSGGVALPFSAGRRSILEEGQSGTLPTLPDLPKEFDVATTAAYIRSVMDGASLTALRTGAASGLATDLLARADASTVAIIGTGASAGSQRRMKMPCGS